MFVGVRVWYKVRSDVFGMGGWWEVLCDLLDMEVREKGGSKWLKIEYGIRFKISNWKRGVVGKVL